MAALATAIGPSCWSMRSSDVFEPADEAARGFRVGARCGVHEIAVAFHGYARQRAAQASLGLVRAKEVLRGDDRSQAFANGVHGNEKMIEAMPPFEKVVMDARRVQP